jgi:hypothetical protein
MSAAGRPTPSSSARASRPAYRRAHRARGVVVAQRRDRASASLRGCRRAVLRLCRFDHGNRSNRSSVQGASVGADLFASRPFDRKAADRTRRSCRRRGYLDHRRHAGLAQKGIQHPQWVHALWASHADSPERRSAPAMVLSRCGDASVVDPFATGILTSERRPRAMFSSPRRVASGVSEPRWDGVGR